MSPHAQTLPPNLRAAIVLRVVGIKAGLQPCFAVLSVIAHCWLDDLNSAHVRTVSGVVGLQNATEQLYIGSNINITGLKVTTHASCLMKVASLRSYTFRYPKWQENALHISVNTTTMT